MNKQTTLCKHKKAEEQYLCLEESCLSNEELKLDCHSCLIKLHPHQECIYHIDDIIVEAQENQQAFSGFIDSYLKFCEDLYSKLKLNVDEMKQKITQWLDQQQKILLQQIEKYQLKLNEQKKKITSNQLNKEQLKDLVEFRNFDKIQYTASNLAVQQILEENDTSFSQYFSVQFERISSYYSCNQISVEDFPKITQTFIIPKIIPFEKCQNDGCGNIEKTRFCLEKSCLLSQNLNLECPMCQVENHQNTEILKLHKPHFISGNKLWELQNKYIDELEQFCDQKASKIQQDSLQLQQTIVDFQKMNEQKLQTFRTFIIQKEKEIIKYLQKFKQQYQKERFTIYRELLMQTDLSVGADIVVLENNFEKIANSFKQQQLKEKDLSQEMFQKLWLQGQTLLQEDALCQEYGVFINPVAKCIQSLNDQIINQQQTIKKLKKKIVQQNEAQSNDSKNISKIMDSVNQLTTSLSQKQPPQSQQPSKSSKLLLQGN